ncbi:YceI family protein [Enterovibrio calviensis]|uniref:YceI family protein n=1 Tax=Enterovibrio calviensis TaxID=91359 RepID=UPI000486EBAA|nr:YceI family protein [Enterovibrio calviensis]
MKKTLIALGLGVATVFSTAALADDYVIDTNGAHASINFKVPHLGYSFIKGRFNDFGGNFSYDPSNVTASNIVVNIDTTSLDSNHAERDKHLRSDDFINASKYSTATFKSTSVEENGDGTLTVNGDLTLHGKTNPIAIQANFIGEGSDPWGGYRAGFEGSTRLALKDYGIAVVGASSYVDLELHVEGIRQ